MKLKSCFELGVKHLECDSMCIHATQSLAGPYVSNRSLAKEIQLVPISALKVSNLAGNIENRRNTL